MYSYFTIIAIGSAFFGALANIWARVLLKDITAKDLLGLSFLCSAVILLFASPWFYFFKPSYLDFGLILLIGVIDSAGNYFYFKTFEQSEASVATPVLSLAPAFTFIFAWIFLADSVPLKNFLASLCVIVLVVIFSADFSDFKKFRSATLRPAVLSSLLFGISAIPAKYLLTNLQATNALTLYMFRAALIAAFAFLFIKPNPKNLNFNRYRQVFLRSFLVIAQWGLLYWALSLGHAGVTVTLANITPVFVFILGVLFLQEEFRWKKAFASVLIVVFSLLA